MLSRRPDWLRFYVLSQDQRARGAPAATAAEREYLRRTEANSDGLTLYCMIIVYRVYVSRVSIGDLPAFKAGQNPGIQTQHTHPDSYGVVPPVKKGASHPGAEALASPNWEIA